MIFPNRGEHLVRRSLQTSPQSYDPDTRTCEAVIATNSPVPRFFGTEILECSGNNVDLSRMFGAGIPVLDSHSQGSIDRVLGRLTDAHALGDKVIGRIAFAETKAGRLAEQMVARGELRALSAGYRVDEWIAHDSEGREILAVVGEDDDLVFRATRWQLLEVSVVCVPADQNAMIRSFGFPSVAALARARMEARQRMMNRYAKVLRSCHV